MGLAAGQARLLTITGRKSDCEFESMRLSHQKIALARQLADLSNEYQDSLTRTKLVYDYYGTGDTSMQLGYDILMTPSALNGYMPTTLTDSMGRVALSSKLAAAAAAAGIPQEGLGTLPSEDMRNAFIEALSIKNIVTEAEAAAMEQVPYAQSIGFGQSKYDTTIITENISYDELIENYLNHIYVGEDILDNNSVSDIGENNFSNTRALFLINNSTKKYYRRTGAIEKQEDNQLNNVEWCKSCLIDLEYDNEEYKTDKGVTLGSLLEEDYLLCAVGMDNRNAMFAHAGGALDALSSATFIERMINEMENLLDVGNYQTQQALAYAKREILNILHLNNDYIFQGNTYDYENPPTDGDGAGEDGDFDDDCPGIEFDWIFDNKLLKNDHDGEFHEDWWDYSVIKKAIEYGNEGYIGYNALLNQDWDGDWDDDSCMSAGSINLSSIFKAYLTYFADYMNGRSQTYSDGTPVYSVGDTKADSHFVNGKTNFTINTGKEITGEDCKLAAFYDALFNQIAKCGWTENGNLQDKNYLQNMIQTGMLYISQLKDDGFYYRTNYNSYNYVKEIEDESFIAQAEAKYNTEKAKLNSKEETLDMKMKNLDTEISSLTTEYDTVKNVISKQIERTFKRYSA